ncbi:Tetratricopeptide repeat [Dillenia turbinata]|uniref:Tetratricopeptide repeat n=1 Tax=Dillenia turbinata TaxID=194707 RepID=A0AAN8YVF8_9MAGN
MEGGNEKSPNKVEKEAYHVLHKLPPGDSPYVRAKHMQLVEKDPDAAIVLFWKAINAGDRVDSALKDMAVVMKQQDRAEEAIEAIKLEEQIELLKQKLRRIYKGETFNGKPTKTARSHGRKFHVTIKQETSKILGNLGWAYMQQTNYIAAEVVYRKAQFIDPDANKACNLGLCLIKQARYHEAWSVLEEVLQGKLFGSDDQKSRNRAEELLQELKPWESTNLTPPLRETSPEDAFVHGLDQLMSNWTTPSRSKRLPIFEEIYPYRDQLAC